MFKKPEKQGQELKLSKQEEQEIFTKIGSVLHDGWRDSRKQGDDSYESREKETEDEDQIKENGTKKVDIANLSFPELPKDWQEKNRVAAEVVINIVLEAIESGQTLNDAVIEEASAIVHDEWLKRNDWVYHPEHGDPVLAKPYEELPKEEKEKDRAQVREVINFLKQKNKLPLFVKSK